MAKIILKQDLNYRNQNFSVINLIPAQRPTDQWNRTIKDGPAADPKIHCNTMGKE